MRVQGEWEGSGFRVWGLGSTVANADPNQSVIAELAWFTVQGPGFRV